MSMYHKFYIKQMNLELGEVQPIYVQKKIWFLAMSDGFAIEVVNIFCLDISIFHALDI